MHINLGDFNQVANEEILGIPRATYHICSILSRCLFIYVNQKLLLTIGNYMSHSPSTSEILLHSTVKITSISNGQKTGTGTAFYTLFNKTHESVQPVIITNKHVVDGADQISIRCHAADPETYKPTGDLIDVTVALHDTLMNWGWRTSYRSFNWKRSAAIFSRKRNITF